MSEIAKTDAPTLFQVNGPVGLANWKDYCYDLSGSKIAGELSSDDFALMDGSAMSGIAYVIETYGIIVNTKLLGEAGYSGRRKGRLDRKRRRDVCGWKQLYPCQQTICKGKTVQVQCGRTSWRI